MYPKLRPSFFKIALSQTILLCVTLVCIPLLILMILSTENDVSNHTAMIITFLLLMILMGAAITCVILFLIGLYTLCNNLAYREMDNTGAQQLINGFWIQFGASILSVVIALLLAKNNIHPGFAVIVISLIAMWGLITMMNGAHNLSYTFSKMKLVYVGYMLVVISSGINLLLEFMPEIVASILTIVMVLASITSSIIMLVGWWGTTKQAKDFDNQNLNIADKEYTTEE